MAIGAQLGDPIATLTVNLDLATPPSGLIQEFEKLIHFGAIRFNVMRRLHVPRHLAGAAARAPKSHWCSKRLA